MPKEKARDLLIVGLRNAHAMERRRRNSWNANPLAPFDVIDLPLPATSERIWRAIRRPK